MPCRLGGIPTLTRQMLEWLRWLTGKHKVWRNRVSHNINKVRFIPNKLPHVLGLLAAAGFFVAGEASAHFAKDMMWVISSGLGGNGVGGRSFAYHPSEDDKIEWYKGSVAGIRGARAFPIELPDHVAQPLVISQFARPSLEAFRQEEEIRLIIIVVATTVFIFSLVGCILVLMHRDRGPIVSDRMGPSVPRAFLIDTYGFTNQMRHELDAKPTMLGRVAGTDSEHINYVVVGFSTVSRRHAVIEYKESAFFIADQGSLNGTYVNDQQISGDVRLMHGDRIRINRFEFEFVISDLIFSGKTREVRRPVSTKPEPILVDEIEEEESPDLDKTIEVGKKSGSEKMVDALKFATVRSVGVKVHSGMYKAERGGKVQYVHAIPNGVLPQPRRKENNLWLVAQGIGTWNQKGFR